VDRVEDDAFLAVAVSQATKKASRDEMRKCWIGLESCCLDDCPVSWLTSKKRLVMALDVYTRGQFAEELTIYTHMILAFSLLLNWPRSGLRRHRGIEIIPAGGDSHVRNRIHRILRFLFYRKRRQ